MILVSCRRNRLSDRDFVPRHQHEAFEVELGDIITDPDQPDSDPAFDAVSAQLIQQAEAAPKLAMDSIRDRAQDKHVLVLVHGYRNPYPNVSRAYHKIGLQLKDHGLTGGQNYDLVIGYLWPGRRLRAEFLLAVHEANRAGSH